MKVVLFIAAVAIAAITVEATLVDTLKAIHMSPAFKNLTHAEQLVLVELFAEAQAGEVKVYIDTVGFQNVLDVIDNLPESEAHRLTHFLVQELNKESSHGGSTAVGKRDLASVLKELQSNNAFQHLSVTDQSLAQELVTAAENHQLTQLVNKVGYAEVLTLLDSLPQTEEHRLSVYLEMHLKQESHHQG